MPDSGNTRGTLPGTGLPLHPVALVDPILPRSNCLDAARVVHASQRALPAYEWAFGDSSARACWPPGKYKIDKKRREKETNFLSDLSKVLLNFTWWVTERTPRKNIFQVDSWVSTTSAFFAAAQRFPLEAHPSSLMGQDGWRCTP